MKDHLSYCRNYRVANLALWLILLWLTPGLVLTAMAQKQKPTRRATTKATVTQGICGTVVVKRGNYTPTPDAPRPNPGGTPVEREVLIFPLLNMGQVEMGDNGFVASVGTAKPVKTVKSGKDGAFCISLPEGRYSIVVREPKGLYANLSDGEGNLFPVSVGKGKKAQVTVEITHEAVF